MTEARIRVITPELEQDTVILDQGEASRKSVLNHIEPPIIVEHGIFPDSNIIVQQEGEIYEIQPGKTVELEMIHAVIEIEHKGLD